MTQSMLFEKHTPEIDELMAARTKLCSSVYADATRRGYTHDWKQFTRWCLDQGRRPLPSSTETVALYLTYVIRQRGLKIASAVRYTAAINYHHRNADLALPATREIFTLLKGAQRELRQEPTQKAPLTVDRLRQICLNLRALDIATIRDRALLLFGFASALRRSNIVRLNVADVKFCDEGLLVQVAREKNNQDGPPRVLGIPCGTAETCPVTALRRWITARGDWEGALFTVVSATRALKIRMSPERVALIVKAEVQKLGLDPCHFGAHSMRAGFATTALDLGLGEIRVAAHTGHRSLSSLRRYYRPESPFRSNPCGALGL